MSGNIPGQLFPAEALGRNLRAGAVFPPACVLQALQQETGIEFDRKVLTLKEIRKIIGDTKKG